MELLKEVANISGRGGLFRIVKPGRSGVIVESLDGIKKREMVPSNARVSVLKDISIYKEGLNESKPLAEIFIEMRQKHGEKIEMDTKNADSEELYGVLGEIMPDFDRERVHASDVKKLINWYNVLSEKMPELWDAKPEEKVEQETVTEDATPEKEAVAEEPEVKKASKKKK